MDYWRIRFFFFLFRSVVNSYGNWSGGRSVSKSCSKELPCCPVEGNAGSKGWGDPIGLDGGIWGSSFPGWLGDFRDATGLAEIPFFGGNRSFNFSRYLLTSWPIGWRRLTESLGNCLCAVGFPELTSIKVTTI